MPNPFNLLRDSLNKSRAGRWNRSAQDQRSLDEGLRPMAVEGWKDGAPIVRPLGGTPLNTGRLVTNGSLADGPVCADFAGGVVELDGVPFIPQKADELENLVSGTESMGILMPLDLNAFAGWNLVPGDPGSGTNLNRTLLEGIFNYFDPNNQQKMYVLESSDLRVLDDFNVSGSEYSIPGFAKKELGWEIIETPINGQISGPFYLPILGTFLSQSEGVSVSDIIPFPLTAQEIAILRTTARRYGVIVMGERLPYIPWNNYVLEKIIRLNVTTVDINEDELGIGWMLEPNNPITQNIADPNPNIADASGSKFQGNISPPNRIICRQLNNLGSPGLPTMILFKP